MRPASIAIDESKIVSLIDARNAARKAKNFKESDRIRDELAAMGVVLEGQQGRHHLGDRAMMAMAHPKLALRPFLPADTPLLREIFRDSIEDLTADDYTEAQQEAWASAADDEKAFGNKLAGELTLVATLAGSPVGFAALAGKDKIDMLYVHPGGGRAGRRRHAGRCAGEARRLARRRQAHRRRQR